MKMSQMSKANIQSFRAPLSISATCATASGSWSSIPTPSVSDILIASEIQIMRKLHSWQQQYRNNVFEMTLAWVENEKKAQFLYLHVSKSILNIDVGTLGPYIQSILNESHAQMYEIYQQAHPGAVRSWSVARSVGNEGASQSN